MNSATHCLICASAMKATARPFNSLLSLAIDGCLDALQTARGWGRFLWRLRLSWFELWLPLRAR